ncbi:MAG TPA: hypothetical protein VGM50_02440 [Gemmatimonadaceae bacterium]|jgi:hypothetical protein
MIRHLSTAVRFVYATAAALSMPARVMAQTPAGRTVVFLRDRSSSFQAQRPKCTAAATRAIQALGPGDTFILIDVGLVFDVDSQVYAEQFAPVPRDLSLQPSTLRETRRAQMRLDSIWARAEESRTRLLARVTKHDSIDGHGTDLDAALDYASHRLVDTDGPRDMIICSDLIQTKRGAQRSEPPHYVIPFHGLSATAIFVPWNGGAANDRRAAQWRQWFQAGGATQFVLLDPSQSVAFIPLTPTLVSRRVASPFARRRLP